MHWADYLTGNQEAPFNSFKLKGNFFTVRVLCESFYSLYRMDRNPKTITKKRTNYPTDSDAQPEPPEGDT